VKRITTFAALACALAAAPAAAQDQQDAPAGPMSVSLDVGGGYLVGVWRQTSPRVRAGIEVGTTVSRVAGDGGEEDFTSVHVQPAVKLFSGAGAVRPYTLLALYAQQSGQRFRDDDFVQETEVRRREVGARVGVGLEWRPISRVGVGGHVGAGAGYLESLMEGGSAGEETKDGWTASTFSSGIVIHLFF
jgi:hypothetical protein